MEKNRRRERERVGWFQVLTTELFARCQGEEGLARCQESFVMMKVRLPAEWGMG